MLTPIKIKCNKPFHNQILNQNRKIVLKRIVILKHYLKSLLKPNSRYLKQIKITQWNLRKQYQKEYKLNQSRKILFIQKQMTQNLGVQIIIVLKRMQ